eukprot:6192050-Pleurochrysis_carterae.AAC.3
MALLPSFARVSIDKLARTARKQKPGASPYITPIHACQKLTDQHNGKRLRRRHATFHRSAGAKLLELDLLSQTSVTLCAAA